MRKIILLDRDGVISLEKPRRFECTGDEHKGYILEPDELEFVPHALDALKLLKEKGFEVHVLSNQSAVGRGLLTLEKLDEITRKLVKEVSKHGGNIESVQYCVHRPEEDCWCRKPRPGMFIDLARAYDIDCEDTWFVGDSLTDIEPAKAVGCRSILVNSALNKHNPKDNIAEQQRPDYHAEDLYKAVTEIIVKDGKGA